MRMLEKGPQNHHVAKRSIQMTKQDGVKAKIDEESADVFGQHFPKAFNNHNPLPVMHLSYLWS
eukprot:10486095-Ditylum_brightwellii.AAC.1